MGAAKPCLGHPSRTAAIFAMRAEGKSVTAIAQTIGISTGTVSALECSARRDRSADPRPHGRGRILSEAQLDEMAALRERGWSCNRIAEHFTSAGTPISGNAVNWQCMRVGADAPRRLRGKSSPPTREYRRGAHIVRPYSAEDDRRLIEMDIAGAKLVDIARALGRKENSIRGRQLTLARLQAREEEA